MPWKSKIIFLAIFVSAISAQTYRGTGYSSGRRIRKDRYDAPRLSVASHESKTGQGNSCSKSLTCDDVFDQSFLNITVGTRTCLVLPTIVLATQAEVVVVNVNPFMTPTPSTEIRTPDPIKQMGTLLPQGVHTQMPKERTLAPEIRTLGRETRSQGTGTRSLGRETRTLGKETRSLGRETRSQGRETRSLGTGTRSLGTETRSLGTGTRSLDREARTLDREIHTPATETGCLATGTDTKVKDAARLTTAQARDRETVSVDNFLVPRIQDHNDPVVDQHIDHPAPDTN
ncbi:hypothetical protein BaRGS_00037353 [Batillaria attramentaria]|uniref:Uncharacterized protein n=1 Tax=Batillaria attramentaria TaxID=370345 RepID=A0ABD0JA66_9CAEN